LHLGLVSSHFTLLRSEDVSNAMRGQRRVISYCMYRTRFSLCGATAFDEVSSLLHCLLTLPRRGRGEFRRYRHASGYFPDSRWKGFCRCCISDQLMTEAGISRRNLGLSTEFPLTRCMQVVHLWSQFHSPLNFERLLL
jgi:hypothetical protein